MKSSQYNIFVDAAHGKYFVYNPLKGGILYVDQDLRTYLEENQIDKIDPEFLPPLEAHGFIINDGIDELKIQRLKHNLKKYSRNISSSYLIFTTYSCNLRCPYCYEGPVVDPESKPVFMDSQMTSQVLDFIKTQTLRNRSQMVCIGLYGGEPLLNMECCERTTRSIFEWCSSYGIRFYTTITTNGTLLTEQVYSEIGKYLSSIHITLDGPQQFHDKKRIKADGSGSYTQILNNLKLLKDTKEHLSIRINFDEKSREFMGEVLEDLEAIGLKGRPHFHIYFAQIIPQDACLTFPTDPGYKEWRRESISLFPPLLKMATERGWKTHMAVDIGQEHSLVPVNVASCDYVKDGIYSIDPLGHIYVCPASGGDTRYQVGALRDGDAEWNSSYYNIITRDPSFTAPCKNCEMLPMCGGGCSIAAYFKYKDYHKTFCNFNKELIYRRLEAYLKFKYPEKF